MKLISAVLPSVFETMCHRSTSNSHDLEILVMRRDAYDIQIMIYFIREINKVESQSAKFTAYLECKSAIRPIPKGQK